MDKNVSLYHDPHMLKNLLIEYKSGKFAQSSLSTQDLMTEREFSLYCRDHQIVSTNDDPLFQGLSPEEARAAGKFDLRYREPAKEQRLAMEATEAARQAALEEDVVQKAQLHAAIDMEVDAMCEEIDKKAKAV